MTKREKITQQLEFIKENNINGYIDKHFISKYFNISLKTSERRLEDACVKHMSSELINMMVDISSGIPSTEISKKYKCSLENVNQFARRHNILNRYQYRHRRYSDPYFFNCIDTPNKAYILGFIAADGHVSDKEIKISLSSVDEEILHKIRNIVGFKNTVKNTLNHNTLKPISSVSFGTSEMIRSLRRLGFCKNKTTDFSIPNIDDNLLIYFYRGFVDGDGSFSKYTSNDGYTRYSFSICGTESALNDFKVFFSKFGIKFSKNLYKRFDTENCCYALSASGKNNVLKLLDILYEDVSDSIYLNRKYNKYLDFKK